MNISILQDFRKALKTFIFEKIFRRSTSATPLLNRSLVSPHHSTIHRVSGQAASLFLHPPHNQQSDTTTFGESPKVLRSRISSIDAVLSENDSSNRQQSMNISENYLHSNHSETGFQKMEDKYNEMNGTSSPALSYKSFSGTPSAKRNKNLQKSKMLDITNLYRSSSMSLPSTSIKGSKSNKNNISSAPLSSFESFDTDSSDKRTNSLLEKLHEDHDQIAFIDNDEELTSTDFHYILQKDMDIDFKNQNNYSNEFSKAENEESVLIDNPTKYQLRSFSTTTKDNSLACFDNEIISSSSIANKHNFSSSEAINNHTSSNNNAKTNANYHQVLKTGSKNNCENSSFSPAKEENISVTATISKFIPKLFTKHKLPAIISERKVKVEKNSEKSVIFRNNSFHGRTNGKNQPKQMKRFHSDIGVVT